MRKTICTIICCLFFYVSAVAQFGNEQQRMLKYWYYKDRLHREFMLGIGDGVGLSVPAERRDVYADQSGTLTSPTQRRLIFSKVLS